MKILESSTVWDGLDPTVVWRANSRINLTGNFNVPGGNKFQYPYITCFKTLKQIPHALKLISTLDSEINFHKRSFWVKDIDINNNNFERAKAYFEDYIRAYGPEKEYEKILFFSFSNHDRYWAFESEDDIGKSLDELNINLMHEL